MVNQDTTRNLLVAVGVFLLIWFVGESLIPAPPPRATDATAPAISPPSPPGSALGSESTLRSEPHPAPQAQTVEPSDRTSSGWRILEDSLEQTVSMGAGETDGVERKAPETPFRIRLLVSNLGASIVQATLTDHARGVRDPSRYELLAFAGDDHRGRLRSLAIERINVDDVDLTLHDRRWRTTEGVTDYVLPDGESGQRVVFTLDLAKDDLPLLRVRRTWVLPKQTKESGRHDLTSELSVENLSSEPHRIVMAYRGGVGIRNENPQRDDRVVDSAVRTGDGQIIGRRTLYSAVTSAQKVSLFVPQPADPAARLSWAATANTYFTCTLAPLEDNGSDPAGYLAEVSALDLDGRPETLDDTTLRFVTRPESLAVGKSATYRTDVFVGEKDGEVFRSHAAYKSRNYYFQIAQGFGWCTFGFLVDLMIRLLNGIFNLVPNFGVAIIILVLIVRGLLHPITKKGQVNMVRMQKQMGELGPKIEELKKKHANDKVRLQQETMKLYGESGVSPAGQFLTCLPMLCQMPVWVALWLSLSNNIRMRHEPFVGWIRDLTAPDALVAFASPLHLPLYGPVASFNLLPILLSVLMYVQQKTQPKPKPNPNMTRQQREQQEMMQKMMPIMSIMMLFLFYSAPSGLTLYISTSTLFGTLEQWWIRRHIAVHEAAGTLLKPVRKQPLSSEPRVKSFLGAWLERMAKKAEDAQRLQRSQRAKPRR